MLHTHLQYVQQCLHWQRLDSTSIIPHSQLHKSSPLTEVLFVENKSNSECKLWMSRCLQCSLYLFFPLNFTHLFSPTLLLSFHLLFSSSCLSSLPISFSPYIISVYSPLHMLSCLCIPLLSPLLSSPSLSLHFCFSSSFFPRLVSSNLFSFHLILISVLLLFSSCHVFPLLLYPLSLSGLHVSCLVSSLCSCSHLISSHLISFSPALAYNLVSGLASSILLISSCLSSCFLTFSLMLFFPVLASSLLITFCLFSHFVSVSSHSLLSFCLLLSPPPLILSSSCISSHLSSSL